MKTLLKTLLKYYLGLITKIVLFIHKPTVIAVAGSTNKNFAKQEVKKRLLEMDFNVRANPKNFNTEIGMPLSILYLPSGYNEYRKWVSAIIKAPLRIFQRNFPSFLVLSLGTSDRGDMKYLLSVVKPDISVITDITQKYREGFSDMDNLVEEYKVLAQKTKKDGLLLLNHDNYRVREIGENRKQKVVYYGFDKKADVFILKIKKGSDGQEITVKYKGKQSSYQIKRFGKHHAYSFVIGLSIQKILSEASKR